MIPAALLPIIQPLLSNGLNLVANAVMAKGNSSSSSLSSSSAANFSDESLLASFNAGVSVLLSSSTPSIVVPVDIDDI